MLARVARHVITLLPESTAGSFVCAVASVTRRPPVSPLERQAMKRARRLRYGRAGRNVAWSWGEGPTVIFVHGWGGRAAQMAPLAVRVAEAGFRCVAIDVTGHGASPKHHARWDYFLDDVAASARSLREDVHAYVGHSAGALGVMAARKARAIDARRYVCVCAPSYPFPPIHALERLDSPRGIVDRYKNYVAKQFQVTWEELEAGSSYARAGSDTLLFYDERDRLISHTEGDRILGMCPGARLIKTSSYGHRRILAAPELAHAVREWLTVRS